MPVDTKHPQYDAEIVKWQRCRDAYLGEDAVKERREAYLPKVDPNQNAKEYAAYLKRALYYEAVGRSVDGFVGAIARKPHVITLPPALEVFRDDATADGVGLDEFIKRLCAENMLIGRGGILVDFDEAAARPYLRFYEAECIINWWPDGVVISETAYEPDPKDPFRQIAVDQIRQLHMVDGAYTVTLWRRAPAIGAGAQTQWLIYSTMVPTRQGTPLTEMPWYWLSPMGRANRVEKPPLLALVNVALSHYRSSADLEHGRHFCGTPTLFIAGIVNTEEEISVGACGVIKLPDPQAKAGYAEFSGQGLSSLETALESKEHMMAVLGAAVFGYSKKGVEAAETARIRTSGENSLLMGVVSSVEETLEAALEGAAAWQGEKGVEIALNRDFLDVDLPPQTLVGMVQAVQAGAMSLETFTYCLQQAEMLPPETDIAVEVAKLKAEQQAKDAASAALALKTAAPPAVVAA